MGCLLVVGYGGVICGWWGFNVYEFFLDYFMCCIYYFNMLKGRLEYQMNDVL